MTDKVFATITTLVGGVGVIYGLLDAFGVDISADKQTAITAGLGLLLVVLGLWFHPGVPVGNTGPPPE